MARRSPKAEATREAILDAALSCFAESGFAATTTRAIAKRAGVTQPLIHHYFGSKDALINAVLTRAVLDYEEAQGPRWSMPKGDLRFLTEGLPVLFAWLGANQTAMRLTAWARLEGRAPVVPATDVIVEKVREQVVAAQARGVVRADADVDMAMLVVDAALKGFWDRRADYARQDSAPETLDQRYFKEALTVLLAGLLTPEAAAEARALRERPPTSERDAP